MLRLVAYLVPVVVLAWALSWLADRPGSVLINWQSHEVEISVFHAVVFLALGIGLTILAWSIAVQLWRSPALLGAVYTPTLNFNGADTLTVNVDDQGNTGGAAQTHQPLQPQGQRWVKRDCGKQVQKHRAKADTGHHEQRQEKLVGQHHRRHEGATRQPLPPKGQIAHPGFTDA